jgi:hypothetical protein
MKDHLVQDVLQHWSTIPDDDPVNWASNMLHTIGPDTTREDVEDQLYWVEFWLGSILAGTAITFGMESQLHGCDLFPSAVTFASGGSIKARNGPGQTLEDVAADVKTSVIGSTQRFDLASLSLEWSPNSSQSLKLE